MSDIVTLLKNREEKGLSMLYDKYAPALLGIIKRIVKNTNVGEEVLQQALLKVWNNVDSYDAQKGNFFTWIASIARNTAIDQVRLKGYQMSNNIETLDGLNDADVSVSIPTDDLDASVLLKSLDEKYKVVLDLIYLQGFTQADAAAALNIPLGTVKTRLRSAIQTLRNHLKGEQDLFIGIFILIIFLMLLL